MFQKIIVEYTFADAPLSGNDMEYFVCMADDSEHAREQCENAYPDCTVTAFFHNFA